MPKTNRDLTRREEVYFDRLLAKAIGNYYPEFKQGIVAEEFKNKVLIDIYYLPMQGFQRALNKLGIEYQIIEFWTIIDKEDWNYFKLAYDIKPKNYDYAYYGDYVGPLLLNEIRDFKL